MSMVIEMSSSGLGAAMPGGAGDDGVPSFVRLLHVAGRWLPAAMVLTALLALASVTEAVPERANTLASALVLSWTVGGVFHSLRPCLACAAALPLNGAERAEKRHAMLGVFHAVADRMTRTRWAGAGAVACVVVCSMVLGWLGQRDVAELFVLLVTLTFAPFVACSQVHSMLQPWCPWCRDDGGGGRGVNDPDPDPNRKVPA